MLSLNDIGLAVSDIAPAFDIEKVYLFGSYAREEAVEKSDVDLCIESGKTFSLFSAGDFSVRLEALLGTEVDLVTERSLYPFVRSGFMEDRVLVYERS